MTMEQPLLFQLNDRVGTITFNRLREFNAVNLDMARAMGGQIVISPQGLK